MNKKLLLTLIVFFYTRSIFAWEVATPENFDKYKWPQEKCFFFLVTQANKNGGFGECECVMGFLMSDHRVKTYPFGDNFPDPYRYYECKKENIGEAIYYPIVILTDEEWKELWKLGQDIINAPSSPFDGPNSVKSKAEWAWINKTKLIMEDAVKQLKDQWLWLPPKKYTTWDTFGDKMKF